MAGGGRRGGRAGRWGRERGHAAQTRQGKAEEKRERKVDGVTPGRTPIIRRFTRARRITPGRERPHRTRVSPGHPAGPDSDPKPEAFH